MRIILGVAVVFLAVWFTVLRPKSDAGTPAASATPASTPAGNVNTGAPAQSEAGKVVQRAKTAAAGAETAAKAAAGESSTPADSTTAATAPATGAATTPQTGAATATTSAPDAKAAALPVVPATTLAKLPKDVAGAITDHKVLVLAVLNDKASHWRPMADDDRYVRNTLSKLNRYKGQVLVKQVPLPSLMTYGPLVNDLKVNQTPSVVVVDRKLKAKVLEGYVDRGALNQAIADARSSGIDQLITDPYLRSLNQVCAKGNVSFQRWSLPTIRGHKALVGSVKRYRADFLAFQAAVVQLPAPAQWRGLKHQMKGVLAHRSKEVDTFVKAVRHKDLATLEALVSADATKAERKLDDRFNAVGTSSCAANQRQ